MHMQFQDNRSLLSKFSLVIALLMMSGTAHADVFHYIVNMNAASENPTNTSTGTASGTVDYDSTLHTLALHLDYSGLSGTVTATHFHAVTATSGVGSDAIAASVANVGVATTTPSLPGFTLGLSSGSYDGTLDLTSAGSWNPAFVTAQGSIANCEAALAGALVDGKTYWNVHTTFRTGGEIRGFPVVPEPTTAALAAIGLTGLCTRRRRN
jgi:hypothetical protein